MLGFLTMRYRENTGHLPFFKGKKQQPLDEYAGDADSKKSSGLFESGSGSGEKVMNSSVQSVAPATRQIEE